MANKRHYSAATNNGYGLVHSLLHGEVGVFRRVQLPGFHVGIRAGGQLIHLKLVDEKDPSIPYVEEGEHIHLYLETEGVADFAAHLKAKGVPLVKDLHETPWKTREVVIHDDQGHTLYLGEPL